MQRSTTEHTPGSSRRDDQDTAETPAGDERHGPQISVDLFTGVIMLGIAALFLLNAGSTELDWLFPIVLSYALVAMAVVLIVRGALGFGGKMPLVPSILRGRGVDVLVFAASSVVYVALIPHVGFWIMTALTITVAAVYLDTRRSVKRLIISAVVAVVVCVVAYLMLTEVFYIEFPLGLLDR
jgi:hypothetical protein